VNFFGIGPMELLLILVVALLVFGPARLPEIGSTLGKALHEFREMSRQVNREIERMNPLAEPSPAPPQKTTSTSVEQAPPEQNTPTT